MTLLTGDDFQTALFSQQRRVAALADLERARLTPKPTPQFSYAERLAAGFRQENLFVTHVAPIFATQPVFEDDPDFDAEQFLGSYEQYTTQFPELKRAGSPGELAAIKNRIDGEIKDRRILEGMGLAQALTVYLPAGFLSPENFLPLATASRAAGLVGKAASRGVFHTAARVGTEGALTQALAEMALTQKQGFRTEEEAITNVVAAGLFASVLGGAAGGLGAGKRAATKKLLKAETFTDVVKNTNKHIADELAKPTSELGLALDNLNSSRGLVQPGGTDVLPKGGADDVFGSVLSLDKDDPLRGAFLRAIESNNPNFAKLLGADNRLARLVMKMAFLNPAQRTARSQIKATRAASQALDRAFLTTEGVQGPSVQALVNVNEAVMIRKRALANGIWEGVEKAAKKADLEEGEFLELAGKAVRRGGVNDDPVFARIQDNPQLVDAVNKRAAAYTEISEVLFRTADQVGALSRSDITPGRPESLLSILDSEYISRLVDQDVSRTRLPEFRDAVRRGLESRRDELVPEFTKERDILAKQAAKAENPAHKAFLEGQVKELEEWLGKLDKDSFENTAISVVDNYLSRNKQTVGGSPFQSALRERVLRIDERFLEPFLVNNVADIEARAVRTLLPDLTIADFFERSAGNQPRMALLKEKLDAIEQTVQSVTETGQATPDLARKIVEDLQDLSDDAQAVVLGHTLRLLRNLEAAGVDNIGKTMDVIDEAVKVRKRARKKMQAIDRSRDDLRAEIKAITREGPEFKAAFADELTTMRNRMKALTEQRQLQRAIFDGATEPINKIAGDVQDQLHGNSTTIARGVELKFQDNLFKLPGADTAEEATQQLLSLARATHSQVTGARRYVYKLNVDPEHLEAAIRREVEKGLPNADKPGKRAQIGKRMERDVVDVRTMHERIRNRHGVGATGDAFALTSKRIRDFNFMTKMGSVVFSSFPDMAMAVSTAGMGNYARSIARFVKTELFADESARRTYGQELQRAIERFGIFKRHDKLYSLGDDFLMGSQSRVGKAFDKTTDAFASLTLMDRWNAAHKMIASQAIESRLAKTVLAGDSASKADLALLDFFGVARRDIKTFRSMLEKNSTDEGGLRLTNIEEWSNRNARIKWEAAVMDGVQKTIITPTAGDLPNFAGHPLGKMLIQFRSFSFAASNKFLLPGLQRTFALGDPGPALAFVMASVIGTAVFAMNEMLKGKDPTEADVTDLVYEGVDRGGGLGILTEATSSGLRLLNGLGVEGLGAGPSRFRSRNAVDAVLGPTLGAAKNAVDLLALPFREDFSQARDASNLRRMIPFQNLWLTEADARRWVEPCDQRLDSAAILRRVPEV